MSRQPSEKTMLANKTREFNEIRRENTNLSRELRETQMTLALNRTHNAALETEVREWKERFDILLSREEKS